MMLYNVIQMINLLQIQEQGDGSLLVECVSSAVKALASKTDDTALPQIIPEKLRLGLREEPIAHYVFPST
jgi:hypothetical protein